MAIFRYEGFDQTGKAKRGTVEAGDQNSALAGLRSQGLSATRLEPILAAPLPASSTAPPSALPPRAEAPSFPQEVPRLEPGFPNRGTSASPPILRQPLLRASSKDMALFYRNMASLVNAGMGLGAALGSMAQAAPSAALRSACRQMAQNVMTGAQMSELMPSFPGIFSPLHSGITAAGERGGFLVASFERLEAYCERDYALQTAFKRETWYPKLIALAGIFIPTLVPFFLQGFNAWLAVVIPSLIKLAFLFLLWRAYLIAVPFIPQEANPLRIFWDRVRLYIPLVGKVSRALATAKFCRAYGALYAAGVGPGEAMRLGAQACGNVAVASEVRAQIPSIERGVQLTEALRATNLFAPLSLQMLQIGEQSGDLDSALDKAADFLETDAETAVKQTVPVIGILMFLFVVIAFIIPTLMSQVQGVANQYDDLMKD